MEYSFPENYGWVLFIELLIVLQLLIMTYSVVSPARIKTFTSKFMNENFGEEFREIFKRDPDPMGYPDMGNGRFSKKLPFADWYAFNNSQRAVYNYVENMPVVLTCVPIAGLKFEYYAIGFGAAYLIGRTIYSIGYVRSGSKGRTFGAILLDLALLGLIVVAFMSCFYLLYD